MILNAIFCYPQDKSEMKNINIIFTINNEITFNLRDFKILNEKGEFIGRAEYMPGVFLLEEYIYQKIMSDNTISYITFNDVLEIGESKVHQYKIPLNSTILNKEDDKYFYCVIALFNRYNRKLKIDLKINLEIKNTFMIFFYKGILY